MTKEEFDLMMLGLEDVGFPGGAAKLREHEEELRKVIARNVGALRNSEEALARVEAELNVRAEHTAALIEEGETLRKIAAGLHSSAEYCAKQAMDAQDERDTAQAQLAEAVGLLREIESAKVIFNVEKFELNRRLVALLARHAQAEQQEAKLSKTSALAHFDEEVAELRTFVESGEYALSGVNVVYNHSQHVNDKRPIHPYRIEATLYLRRAAPNEYA